MEALPQESSDDNYGYGLFDPLDCYSCHYSPGQAYRFGYHRNFKDALPLLVVSMAIRPEKPCQAPISERRIPTSMQVLLHSGGVNPKSEEEGYTNP